MLRRELFNLRNDFICSTKRKTTVQTQSVKAPSPTFRTKVGLGLGFRG